MDGPPKAAYFRRRISRDSGVHVAGQIKVAEPDVRTEYFRLRLGHLPDGNGASAFQGADRAALSHAILHDIPAPGYAARGAYSAGLSISFLNAAWQNSPGTLAIDRQRFILCGGLHPETVTCDGASRFQNDDCAGNQLIVCQ